MFTTLPTYFAETVRARFPLESFFSIFLTYLSSTLNIIARVVTSLSIIQNRDLILDNTKFRIM